MREIDMPKVEGERNVEERDFLKIKKEIAEFLQHKLRHTQHFGDFSRQSIEIKKQRTDYLEGIINSLERGNLSPAREYFAKLMEEKEGVVARLAGDLREAIAAAKPKIDKLNKENARLLEKLEKAKDRGDVGKIQAIIKEIGNVDDAIGGVGQGQEEIRQSLKKAQDDPDLEKFRKFVAAIDAELERAIRKN
ncbi:hypothetical protein HZB93_00840 [Candidatus Falkowbacteria bacterium]|nr:hypothetical protein [Candidatus Falkowbacteria bacterium]